MFLYIEETWWMVACAFQLCCLVALLPWCLGAWCFNVSLHRGNWCLLPYCLIALLSVALMFLVIWRGNWWSVLLLVACCLVALLPCFFNISLIMKRKLVVGGLLPFCSDDPHTVTVSVSVCQMHTSASLIGVDSWSTKCDFSWFHGSIFILRGEMHCFNVSLHRGGLLLFCSDDPHTAFDCVRLSCLSNACNCCMQVRALWHFCIFVVFHILNALMGSVQISVAFLLRWSTHCDCVRLSCLSNACKRIFNRGALTCWNLRIF